MHQRTHQPTPHEAAVEAEAVEVGVAEEDADEVEGGVRTTVRPTVRSIR